MNSENQIERRSLDPVWGTPILGLASLLAIASASCCVLPMGLSIIGLGGAWLAVLAPFTAYRTVILIGVGLVLLLAWWGFLFRRKGCVKRSRTALILNVACTLFFVVGISAPIWEQDAMKAMWSYWTEKS